MVFRNSFGILERYRREINEWVGSAFLGFFFFQVAHTVYIMLYACPAGICIKEIWSYNRSLSLRELLNLPRFGQASGCKIHRDT